MAKTTTISNAQQQAFINLSQTFIYYFRFYTFTLGEIEPLWDSSAIGVS